jgi:hypothetical protein
VENQDLPDDSLDKAREILRRVTPTLSHILGRQWSPSIVPAIYSEIRKAITSLGFKEINNSVELAYLTHFCEQAEELQHVRRMFIFFDGYH